MEARLQRVEDYVLSLFQIIGRACGLALLAHDLAQIGRQRSNKRRAGGSDGCVRGKRQRRTGGPVPCVQRKRQRRTGQLLKNEIRARAVTGSCSGLIGDKAGWIGNHGGVDRDASPQSSNLRTARGDSASEWRRAICKQRQLGTAAQ